MNYKSLLPVEEISISYTKSSGPGGQNVNKLNTKVVLRWDVHSSTSIPSEIKKRFMEKYAKRLTNNGEIIITSSSHRTQKQNLTACQNKLIALLNAVATTPKKRRVTKPSAAAREKRISEKKQIALKKARRSKSLPVE